MIRDAATGERVRSGPASHPDGSEVKPAHWWGAIGRPAAAGELDEAATDGDDAAWGFRVGDRSTPSGRLVGTLAIARNA